MGSKMLMDAFSGGRGTSILALIQVNPVESDSSPWSAYFRIILLLAGLLCLCFVLLWLFRHRAQWFNRGPHGSLEVIDRLGLEPRRTLYMVRVGPRYMALAASETGIQLLVELAPGTLVPPPPRPEQEGQVS